MPKPANNAFKKLELNFTSLFDIIFFGTPCNLFTYLMKTYDTLLAENVDFTRMKCTTFVNLSTMIMMESCCFTIHRKPAMKSMEITSHFHSRIVISCSNPPRFLLSLHMLTIKTPSDKCYYISLQVQPIVKYLHCC